MHNVSYYANGRLWNDAECNQDLFLVPVEQEAYTTTCWVARDKDGGLWAFEEKPERFGTYWERMPCSEFVSLPSDAFPSLRWRNKPIEVTLTIKRKEENK